MGSKRFIHYLVLFGFFCPAVHAIDDSGDDRYDTFGGINYRQSVTRPVNEWNQLFVKTQPGLGAYLGWRFHPRFSAECGYEWSQNKPLGTGIGSGSSLLGVTNGSALPVELTGTVRFKTGHFDLNTFFPFTFQNWLPEWIVSLGVGATKPNMKINGTAINNTGSRIPLEAADAGAQNFASQFSQIEGKSMAVFRGGFGLQTSVLENVGVRALVRYERTSVLRGRGISATENPATAKIFQNGFSLSLGLYLKF